ncbi:helix-hairpin-helix domain-containing protein [Cytobacillus sp. FJAT-53684]|uniref:Helix-hairpin-helix domain-containing protein n=1 Tax=Cytobacillus mangrovibacter TaxID=3299024 RepID=A0ABW6JY32_9BACI
MIDWLKANKLYVAGGIIIGIVFIYFLIDPLEDQSNMFEDEEEWLDDEENVLKGNVEDEAEVVMKVIVDVKGAVRKPGVYEAESDERVIDMINKAGGLTETADEAKINFAIRVEDEMVIYVPEVGEEMEQVEGTVTAAGSTEQADGKININTADESQLQTLPGIGPAKAAAIIEFRDKSGPFKAIEDLKMISGIGEKSFEKLQDSIKVK